MRPTGAEGYSHKLSRTVSNQLYAGYGCLNSIKDKFMKVAPDFAVLCKLVLSPPHRAVLESVPVPSRISANPLLGTLPTRFSTPAVQLSLPVRIVLPNIYVDQLWRLLRNFVIIRQHLLTSSDCPKRRGLRHFAGYSGECVRIRPVTGATLQKLAYPTT